MSKRQQKGWPPRNWPQVSATTALLEKDFSARPTSLGMASGMSLPNFRLLYPAALTFTLRYLNIKSQIRDSQRRFASVVLSAPVSRLSSLFDTRIGYEPL